MKKLLVALTIAWLVVCIASWIVYRTPPLPPVEATAVDAPAVPTPTPAPEPVPEPAAPAAPEPAPATDLTDQTNPTDQAAPSGAAPSAPSPTALPPDQAMEALSVTFRNYAQRFKGNPVGNNAEITAALRGGNPQQVQFIEPAVNPVNGAGELVDAWGTPYFFHQLSGSDMEIRSAGADKTMWTADDLLTR